MSEAQLSEFLTELRDFLTDSIDVFESDPMEIYATVLAVGVDGLKKHALENGISEEVEEGLEQLGIKVATIDEEDLDLIDSSEGKTIH